MEVLTAAAATANPLLKVAAICGSLRSASRNRGLIRSVIDVSNEFLSGSIEMEYVDVSPLPLLNMDLEDNGKYPLAVEAFRQKILEADCFLFASPEYNYSVSPILKNAVDWGSMPPNLWAGKTAAIISAGEHFGGGRAQYHLRQIGVSLELHFINKPELYLKQSEFPPKFDDNGDLIDPSTRFKLRDILLALQSFTLRLQGR